MAPHDVFPGLAASGLGHHLLERKLVLPREVMGDQKITPPEACPRTLGAQRVDVDGELARRCPTTTRMPSRSVDARSMAAARSASVGGSAPHAGVTPNTATRTAGPAASGRAFPRCVALDSAREEQSAR